MSNWLNQNFNMKKEKTKKRKKCNECYAYIQLFSGEQEVDKLM